MASWTAADASGGFDTRRRDHVDFKAAPAAPDSKQESRITYHALIVRVGRRRPHPARLLRSRLFRYLAILAALFSCAQLYLLHEAYYQALIEKFSPTTFARSSPQQEDVLASRGWQVDPEDQDGPRRRLLDSREAWKKLGSGYEGEAFAFNNSVIKVFTPDRSPLRNCVPGTEPGLQWPPEIPASVLLGGLHHDLDAQDGLAVVPDHLDFVPVLDYFHLPTTPAGQAGEWFLVTPFLHAGTLEHLARRLRRAEPPLTPDEVDARFRPSLDRVLRTLETMHARHELCHDDVKMDNVFVGGRDAHWLLADLGNARQPSHGYHASLLWAHDNGQHADCRVNDVVRLVRTYAAFLRAAAGAPAAEAEARFGEALLGASSAPPWSQLYWYAVNAARAPRGGGGGGGGGGGWEGSRLDGATAAARVRHLSATRFATARGPAEQAEQAGEGEGEGRGAGGDEDDDEVEHLARPRPSSSSAIRRWLGLGDPVEAELRTGMGVSEKWAVIFGRLGILKTPSRHC